MRVNYTTKKEYYIAGGAANGCYDWPAVKKIFDAITGFFNRKDTTKK